MQHYLQCMVTRQSTTSSNTTILDLFRLNLLAQTRCIFEYDLNIMHSVVCIGSFVYAEIFVMNYLVFTHLVVYEQASNFSLFY